ncbi:WASH complex subunit 1-like [Aethina tumida]|uniref:WASH complex subunit 1-like n=1 Tax=Aethina tumida TaxID=116153 RepID=UPI002147F767|nr:WASH complex subunit 1-like [Aethina tumida]
MFGVRTGLFVCLFVALSEVVESANNNDALIRDTRQVRSFGLLQKLKGFGGGYQGGFGGYPQYPPPYPYPPYPVYPPYPPPPPPPPPPVVPPYTKPNVININLSQAQNNAQNHGHHEHINEIHGGDYNLEHVDEHEHQSSSQSQTASIGIQNRERRPYGTYY